MPVSAFPQVDRISGALHLERLQAKVDIVEAVAHTTLLMQVRNPSALATTGLVRVPMPSGGVLTGFNLTSPTGAAHGRVIDHADPPPDAAGPKPSVVLAQVSERLLEFRITVAAGARWTIEASYAELVPLHQQARVYRFPLQGLGSDVVGRLDIEVGVHSRHGIDDVSTPGLAMATTAAGHQDVEAEASLVAEAPVDDAIVIWSEGPGGWPASMLCSARPTGGWAEGIFLLQARTTMHIPRDVVFVIDHSGSMTGGKMEAAREALAQALGRLSPTDQYEVIEFDDEVAGYHSSLVAADAAAVATDQKRLRQLQPGGLTNIDGGLQLALQVLGTTGGNRAPEIVLLTDGFPTAGVTNSTEIAQRFSAANLRSAPLHVVSIGLDADRSFLDDVAVSSGGDLEVIRLRDGQVQERIASFLDRLTAPVATGLRVTVQGFEHSGDLEGPFPTIREDSTMAIAFGDDWAEPTATWQVRAMTAAGAFERPFVFTHDDCHVVPAAGPLAGRAHLEDLLTRERTNGTTPELEQRIRSLALRHELASPYTGWVLVAGSTSGGPSAPSSPGTPARPLVVARPETTSEGAAGNGTAAAEEGNKGTHEAPGLGMAAGTLAILLSAGTVAARRCRNHSRRRS